MTQKTNRRAFLKKSAIGTAACAAAPAIATEAPTDPEDTRLDERGLFPPEEKTFHDLLDDEGDGKFYSDTNYNTEIYFAPGENPIPFIRRMRAEGRHVAMIQVSGPSNKEARDLAVDLGEEGYFTSSGNYPGVFRRDALPDGVPDYFHEVDTLRIGEFQERNT